jgi:excisionase family DNA binding protein
VSDQTTISLHDAADRLGVHYMTIYRYVRLGLLPAHKEGGSWRVDEADLDAFTQPSVSPPERRDAPWSERLEARMIAGDVSGSWSVIEAALASGADPQDIYLDVLAPALASIGDKWVAGDISIGDEHLASAVASRIIGRLGPRFARRGRPRGTVVTAMPPGERHGFGLSMLADVLRGAGFDVLDLGPDTPTASLLGAIAKTERLHAICISVVFDDALLAAEEMVRTVKAIVGDVPVLAGGRAVVDADHALSLGADGWAPDPAVAADLIDRLNAARRTA